MKKLVCRIAVILLVGLTLLVGCPQGTNATKEVTTPESGSGTGTTTPVGNKVIVTITGDNNKVTNATLNIDKDLKWSDIKSEVINKVTLKSGYLVYFKLDNNSGDWINNDYVFSENKTVYAVTAEFGVSADGKTLTGCAKNTEGKKIPPVGKIVLPEGIETISQEVFDGCNHITEVKFPRTLKIIEYAAFFETSLTKVDLSNTQITSIGKSAFAGIGELTQIKFPNTLETIGEIAFKFAGLTEIDLSQTKVKTIGDRSFLRCEKLETVKLPTTLTTIKDSAFSGCSKLETINLFESGVTSIEKMAFEKTAIEILNIPETLPTTLGDLIFSEASLGTIVFPESLTTPADLKTKYLDVLFKGCPNLKIIDLSKTKLESIADETFNGYNKIQEVKFPTTLTTIGENAFVSTTSLQTVDFSNTSVTSIGVGAFTQSSIKVLKVPTTLNTIGANAFCYANFLTAVQFSDDTGYTGWKANDGTTDFTIDISTEKDKSVAFAELLTAEIPWNESKIGYHCTFTKE